jgi:single-strand DNA-binding protein
MFTSNHVVLRGRLTSDPLVRSLPSGSTVTQLELTTTCDGAPVSVPVVVESTVAPTLPDTVVAGAELVVVGHVRRRFFRAGGVTQSRTEVVAAELHPVGRRKAIERTIVRVQSATAELLAR